MISAALFSSAVDPRLIPRGEAMGWLPAALGVDVLFHLLIALSFATLLGMLTSLLRAQPSLRALNLTRAVTVLIFATTLYHLISIWTVWFAHYRLGLVVTGVLACAAVATAALLRPRLGDLPRMASATQIDEMRRALMTAETDLHRRSEEVQQLESDIDQRVRDRTRQLGDTTRTLQTQVDTLRRAEREFLTEKERALVTLRAIADGVISADARGRVSYINPVAERITGWSSAEAIGRPVSEIFKRTDENTRAPLPDPVIAALEHGELSALPSQCRLVSRYGQSYAIEDLATPIRGNDGAVLGVVLVFHDVSAARKMANRMAYLAQHDQLTGLPNRTLLNDRLNRAITHARRNGDRVALMFLDVDRFKHINDSLGHLVGDKLLQSIAKRLERCVRASDTVSRQGGDEFVILLPEVRDANAPAEVATKVLDAIGRPFEIDHEELLLTLSVGIAMFPDDGETVESLTRNADSAMYHAKSQGRNNFQFFTSTANRRIGERQAMHRRLRDALMHSEFQMYYQPRVSLNDGSITAAEALLRWKHPTLGLIGPEQFIGAAEESGLMVPIGRWVVQEACRQSAEWRGDGMPSVPIAVNLSQAELNDRRLVDELRPIYEQSGLPTGSIEFEMSERAAHTGRQQSLTALHDLGIGLAIDDFGSGEASLTTLRRLPIESVRIDRALVRNLPNGHDEPNLLRGVLGMTRGLNVLSVAKGIETVEQLQYLRHEGCDQGQGFLFGQPLPPLEFRQLFKTEPPAALH